VPDSCELPPVKTARVSNTATPAKLMRALGCVRCVGMDGMLAALSMLAHAGRPCAADAPDAWGAVNAGLRGRGASGA